ncbi:hypothetical protein ACQPZP_01935 [Spirillospora sp. CA-142024]|uniref:hypothetical protein n=1 Tax=Spirillospora sp. CA-142024 TaxID=3240036 RepID=UPI003D8D93C0
MARMTKMELSAAIRWDARLEGTGVRALARKYGVHRRTAREALTSTWPQPRKRKPPRWSRLDPFKPVIDRMLRADLDAPRKQRHTVRRIVDRLTFNATIIETGTQSYRLSRIQARQAAAQP